MTIVYYHKNCFDGMASAWAAWRAFGESAKYIPINYGESTVQFEQDCYENAIINDEIYFIDFSLPRKLMDMIYNKAKKLVVLDHHKTAEKELEGAPYAIFDMNKSGAQLAWKYFFPTLPEPQLVRYIGDRDLWLYREENSKEINAYIQSYEMSIDNYDFLAGYLNTSDGLNVAVKAGESLLRYQEKLVNDMCKNHIIAKIGGYVMPVVNASVLFSEVGDKLRQLSDVSNWDNFPPEYGVAAYYFDRADNRQWGLRSIGNFDVSEIAKQYGGGGHKNAAGFITDKNWLGE